MIGRGSSGPKLSPREEERAKLQFHDENELNAGRRIGAPPPSLVKR
jgi:hypothetical protein